MNRREEERREGRRGERKGEMEEKSEGCDQRPPPLDREHAGVNFLKIQDGQP